ncbi:heterokaryon incompatibility protein-domain-containing protein [Xylaria palmicola]|nr:heterokaryon incompatibility protein-domain-containing protein [Xylaria palmicola]
MRLINVKTLELEEFFYKYPPYAILSHTWGPEEVTFQEYLLATGPDTKRHSRIKQKEGFPKIVGACKRAQANGLQYLWCDTNCIDKTSSAELSEAINSMYAWYRDSEICYAYLADVEAGRGPVGPGSFKESRWFTRGWTLQELLAPKSVIFFDKRWKVLGHRENLANVISQVTLIHIAALEDRNKVFEYSVAQRMSWAANRVTTREEDIAYCLLGIFDINMPLLYGEGMKAYQRLQREIIKVSDDQSILAWQIPQDSPSPWMGALAPSTKVFQNCGSIVRDPELDGGAYSITNKGILMKLPLIKTVIDGIILVGLNCAKEIKAQVFERVPARLNYLSPAVVRISRIF